MKLAIVGPGRSGKDAAAEQLALHGFRYAFSTSRVIAPYAARRLGLTHEAAFTRRHQDRPLWRQIGDELREHDPAYLARKTLEYGDLCVGVRSLREIAAVRSEGLVDLILWIDRDVPVDDTLEFGPEVADIIVPNRGTLLDFHIRINRLARTWRLPR
jgi:hypothetical protein